MLLLLLFLMLGLVLRLGLLLLRSGRREDANLSGALARYVGNEFDVAV